MTKLSAEEIKNLLELSAIHLEEEAIEDLRKDLSHIVSYMEELNEVNTDGVTPCNHVSENLVNTFRDDEEDPLSIYPRKDFLNNAPEHIAGQIRTPSIIKK